MGARDGYLPEGELIMAMTRKHYRETAEMIRSVVDDTPAHSDLEGFIATGRMQATRSIARSLASMFAEDNPQFDRDKFLDACGL